MTNILIALVVGLIVGWCLHKTHTPPDVEDSTLWPSLPAPPVRQSYPSAVNTHKRHPQFILAMHADFFDGSAHFPGALNHVSTKEFMLWPQTMSALVVKERHALEPDGAYRQLLPYVVVRRVDDDGETRYLAYQRTNSIGEQRLAGKVSVGFGGHIDATDIIWNREDGTTVEEDSILNLVGTIAYAARRERDEELRVAQGWGRDDLEMRDLPIKWGDMFITQQSDPERMHVGIVMFLELPKGIELECAESELNTVGMKTARELLAADHYGEIELEAWSALLLSETVVKTEPDMSHAVY